MPIKIFTSNLFLDMDSAYWGLGFTENELFIALCTHNPQMSAEVYSLNFISKKIKRVSTVSDKLSAKNDELPQGKIHTPLFLGNDGYLYFGTHFAYPFGKPQLIKFEGGHLLSLNPRTKFLRDLGIPIANEGILTLILDKSCMILYGLTAPSNIFFSFDISTNITKLFGQITDKGSICRSLVVDDEGNVYGSFEENRIFHYKRYSDKIDYLSVKLPSSSRSIKEWTSASRGGVNYIGRKIWRSAVWHENTKKVYGIQAEETKLFSFDPYKRKVETLSSMLDTNFTNGFNNIYPTLSLAINKNKIFYSPVDGFFDYSRSENIIGCPSLISYDISTNTVVNHGSIRTDNRKVIGIAGSSITNKGILYLLGAVEKLPDEKYNPFNVINGKGFVLGLIEIDTKKLNYEK